MMQSRIVNILFGNSSAGWVMGTQVPSRFGHFLPQWETEPHRLGGWNPTVQVQLKVCSTKSNLSTYQLAVAQMINLLGVEGG
jgi:hypothetical protein